MRKKCIYTVIAFLLSAAWLPAQDATTTPPAPPSAAQMVSRQVSHLTTLLNLNTAQQTQATTIFTDAQTNMSGLFANMRTARTTLQTAIESNDVAAITTQAAQIGSLTTQEVESRAKADAAFYAILTADQQTKYKQLRAMGHGGPEGFGRPGPGGPH